MPKIISARIVLPTSFGDMAKVYVQFDDGQGEVELIAYFSDEISFTANELVGLTADQALDLRHKKDVAYLQS